ncbi:MAG TPA: GNAT family N-acetyltransferase [Steroidobacteraceae bacterium]|nr:GNAT family N-acetyltransferase [Steroidobacteraceae bacterium]
MSIEIRSEALDEPVVRSLVLALNAELAERYPEEGANHFRLDPEEVGPGRGAFLVAYVDEKPVGCGAVRINEPGVGEIKRMFVIPGFRGRGVAGAVLSALQDYARDLGAHKLVLETGSRQPEAVALYRRAGFIEIPRFGEYVDSPLSLCMGKEL